MARSQLVDDGLWELVEPLLPDRTPQRTGRPRVGDRTAFTAIVFVLVSGGAVADGPSADRLLRGDRLATAQGVAARRGVGTAAPRVPPPPERLRPDRLVARGSGLKPHPRSSRGP